MLGGADNQMVNYRLISLALTPVVCIHNPALKHAYEVYFGI